MSSNSSTAVQDASIKPNEFSKKYSEFGKLNKIRLVLLHKWGSSKRYFEGSHNETMEHCREIMSIMDGDDQKSKLVNFLSGITSSEEKLSAVEKTADILLETMKAPDSDATENTDTTVDYLEAVSYFKRSKDISVSEDSKLDVGAIASFTENNELVKFFDTEEQRRYSHVYRVLDLFRSKNHPLSDSERSVSISMEGDSVVLTCKTSMKRFLEMIEPNNDLNVPLSIRLSGR